MSVPRASVLDYSRELCTTASHSDADILPFGDMNALDNPDPDLACRISCFTIGILLREINTRLTTVFFKTRENN